MAFNEPEDLGEEASGLKVRTRLSHCTVSELWMEKQCCASLVWDMRLEPS